LRVFEQHGVAPVVIVGELSDNPGSSVTNSIERIAKLVRTALPPGRDLLLVEHYPPVTGLGRREATFDLVSFAGRWNDFS
jgi:hypothetical protein